MFRRITGVRHSIPQNQWLADEDVRNVRVVPNKGIAERHEKELRFVIADYASNR